MDGDNRRKQQQQHESSFSRSGSGMGRRPSRPAGSATDRFRQAAGLQPTGVAARGDPSDLSQQPRPRMPTYADYGYTDPSPFQGGPLHPDELQPYTPEFARHQQQTMREHQRQQQQQQQVPGGQPHQFPYEPEMVYHVHQPQQSPYEVVPPYPGASARQSTAIDALSSQFGVPQYFPPAEPAAGPVVSPYLTPQLQSAYNQPPGIGRSSAQPFPGTMAEFTPVASAQQSPPQPQQQTGTGGAAGGGTGTGTGTGTGQELNVGEAYGQFQTALRGTFEHARAGRLIEGSRSLLEISEWLVSNARELGILHDDQLLYSERLKLWNDFNICWLAVCQKQKDMTTDLLQMGVGAGMSMSMGQGQGHLQANTSLLTTELMEDLGRGLIQLCDKLEQHGLVDYQMGIWEEEILSVLTQCLDLMERPDSIHGQAVSLAAAAAASRS